MNAVKINGKRYVLPECWEEVTTAQYIRMVREWEPDKDVADRDYVKLLNILTDGKFQAVGQDIETNLNLIRIMGWVAFQPFSFSTDLPKVLQIHDKKILIPRDPSELSIGQNIHLRRALEKNGVVEASIAIATAIFLQPIVDGTKFNMGRAEELEKYLLLLPAYQIYPIGFFLLKLAASYGRTSAGPWSRVKTSLARMLKGMSLN